MRKINHFPASSLSHIHSLLMAKVDHYTKSKYRTHTYLMTWRLFLLLPHSFSLSLSPALARKHVRLMRQVLCECFTKWAKTCLKYSQNRSKRVCLYVFFPSTFYFMFDRINFDGIARALWFKQSTILRNILN